MTPSLERLALARVREQFPTLQRRGFATTLRSTFPDIHPKEVAIRPDGWFVEGDLVGGEEKGTPATVTCVEIEDHHPLTREKLWLYCDLWDTLDSFGHDLRLFVFDRYGLSERELDLGGLYLNGLIEMAGEKRSRATATS